MGCTVTKTRVLAGGLHTTKQQMIRIDRENTARLTDADAGRLLRATEDCLGEIEALVISDYGDAHATDTYVELARRARVAAKIVVVDSRHALTAFVGVTAVTPNEPEVEEALGVELLTASDTAAAATRLTRDLGLEAALVTRGREGMALARPGADPVLLDAHGGHEAVDVTGAGDTVTAAFTLALAAGADAVEAAELANCAASIVVQRVGTATCSGEDLVALAEEDLP